MKKSWLGNTTPVDPAQLPSRRQLIGATVTVVLLSAFLALTVVLPAELGIDPTGLGSPTGLTEMGLFKVESAREFEEIAKIAAQNVADSIAAAANTAVPPAP